MGKGSKARRRARKAEKLEKAYLDAVLGGPPDAPTGGNNWKSTGCGVSHGIAKLVFDAPLKVYAGAGMQKCPVPRGAVVLDIAGHYPPAAIAQGFQVPGLMRPRIAFGWPDGGSPDLDKRQWAAIAKSLVRLGKPVYVACSAGHGRTGTALAILGHFLRAFESKDTDPIAAVRALYCEDAVEQYNQVEYVKEMTGRATTCTGSLVGKVGAGYGAATTPLCPLKIDGAWCNRDKEHTGACDTRPRHQLIGAGLASEYKYPPTSATTSVPPYVPGGGSKVVQSGPCASWCIRNAPHVGGCLGAAGGQTVMVSPASRTAKQPWVYCPKMIRCMSAAGHDGACKDATGTVIDPVVENGGY